MKHKIYKHAIWIVICIFDIFAGPSLPYKLGSSAMATSPDGGGVILFGGKNYDEIETEDPREDRVLELQYDSEQWTELSQKLKQPRDGHVVIPIPK